ncbi:MAG: nickel pincer cofactor biosynthesis protein LarB [Proteobacteria bacterium]|nr:nickel pincer cofactor biosynthesis protein LarB [Pseudomonadota bacterium]
MDRDMIRQMLDEVASGELAPGEALKRISALPFADIGVAKHDGHRPLRNGFAEVILCEGKRPEHVRAIVAAAVDRGMNAFGTRADESLIRTIESAFKGVKADHVSRTFSIMQRRPEPIPGRLAVLAAGTADIPVAEEALRTAEFFGVEPTRHYDVGVAGLHRLFACLEEIRGAAALIVAAGMDGALPSVVGGLVSSPVIAVPTSVGYGASFNGVAALLNMLCSCSEGVSVVNIDNGFGAACAAIRVMRAMRAAGGR